MIEINKYSKDGEVIGKIQLPESIFEAEAKNPDALLYEVINMYLANQRQGTTASKNRSKVHGSSRKLYRQKGTGNARAGKLRTPVRVGGGVAFGPLPKDWTKHIPRKKKRLALKLALSQKAKEMKMAVVEDIQVEKPNTKFALNLIEKIAPEKGRKLVIIKGSDKNVVKSFSNLQNVETDRADLIHPYEILKANYIIFTEEALKQVGEVFE
jgi:large subunit ribosomal protein L4